MTLSRAHQEEHAFNVAIDTCNYFDSAFITGWSLWGVWDCFQLFLSIVEF